MPYIVGPEFLVLFRASWLPRRRTCLSQSTSQMPTLVSVSTGCSAMHPLHPSDRNPSSYVW